ncbi:MAG TPA: TolC family protein [bacterium]|jgi:outer membrane protein TolC|nr:TolC family protein [bacterium]
MKATLLAAACLAAALPLSAGTLDMDSYLEQVRQGNEQLRSDKALDAAYALQAKQPLTAFSPQLTAQVSHDNDESMPVLPDFSPSSTRSTQWGASLSQFYGTGTNVSLGYAGDYTQLGFPAALAAQLGPLPATYGEQLTLTVSQSLWRNFMASAVQADLALAQASSEGQRAGNRYAAQALLFQARQAFVQLSTVRQVATIQQESLERNQKILEWTKAKFADNLADKVDVLQVQAALQEVALGLSQSREDEAKDRAVFNALRGLSPSAAVDDLAPLAAPASLPDMVPGRQDLVAAQAALRASDAIVQQVTESFTPDLSVFASFGVNQREGSAGSAFDDSLTGDHKTTMVGLKLTANLDLPLYRQVLAGAQGAKGSGEAQVAGKQREIDKDWEQLRQGWSGMQERLGMAQQLESLQKEKADREKVRYQDGRTTNFQVLRFEDDYNLSRVQTLQLTALANVLAATARFYNAEDQPW